VLTSQIWLCLETEKILAIRGIEQTYWKQYRKAKQPCYSNPSLFTTKPSLVRERQSTIILHNEGPSATIQLLITYGLQATKRSDILGRSFQPASRRPPPRVQRTTRRPTPNVSMGSTRYLGGNIDAGYWRSTPIRVDVRVETANFGTNFIVKRGVSEVGKLRRSSPCDGRSGRCIQWNTRKY
jgi:hypothetical protein